MRLLKAIQWRLHAPVEPEIYIVSYPKSGRTWLRVLIGRYLTTRYRLPERRTLDTEWLTHHAGLPVAGFSHDTSAMKDDRHYRDIRGRRSHYADKKVLFLTRDFKDTLVSSFFHQQKRDGRFDGTLPEYLHSEYYGAIKLLTFYEVWRRDRTIPRAFATIGYEDLHRSPEETLGDALRYLGETEISDAALAESVRYGSFQNLRKAEEEDRFNSGILKTREGRDPDSYKVRRGKVGGYADYMSAEDIEYVDGLVAKFGLQADTGGARNDDG